MQLHPIGTPNNTPTMRAGLYFAKKSDLFLNKNTNIKHTTNEVIKISKEGYKFIEDRLIPETIKKRFARIPFIEELSKRFDTFIFYREIPKNKKRNPFNHLSLVKLIWKDNIKNETEIREAIGISPISQDLATNQMFIELENCNLCKNS